MKQEVWTREQFLEHMEKPKKSKYHAKAVKNCPACGFRHPSKMEAARCAYWAEQYNAAEILGYDVHPCVTLSKGISYRPDFTVYEMPHIWDTVVVFEEVKGKVTADFALKRKLFDAHHPCAPLRVITGTETKRGWRWKEI